MALAAVAYSETKRNAISCGHKGRALYKVYKKFTIWYVVAAFATLSQLASLANLSHTRLFDS